MSTSDPSPRLLPLAHAAAYAPAMFLLAAGVCVGVGIESPQHPGTAAALAVGAGLAGAAIAARALTGLGPGMEFLPGADR